MSILIIIIMLLIFIYRLFNHIYCVYNHNIYWLISADDYRIFFKLLHVYEFKIIV